MGAIGSSKGSDAHKGKPLCGLGAADQRQDGGVSAERHCRLAKVGGGGRRRGRGALEKGGGGKAKTTGRGWRPSSPIVFKSPVQSGLLTILGMDLDLDRSRPFLKWYRPRPDRFGPVQSGPKRSIDRSRPVHGLDWSRLVLSYLD